MALRKLTKLDRALPTIRQVVEGSDRAVYSARSLQELLQANRGKWGLAEKTNFTEFGNRLVEEEVLRRIELVGPQVATRWVRPTASPYHLAVSLRPGSYICHLSALILNGVSGLLPHTIYSNKEQPSRGSRTPLTQEALNRAFSRPQRESRLAYTFEDWTLILTSGKNTAELDVGDVPTPTGLAVRCTRLERTLIDVVVRPTYGGGPENILTAFANAKAVLSAQKLQRALRLLDFAYPYHQAIGFYLERAGYAGAILDNMREPGLNFDFYLAHGLKDPQYDPAWRIWYPSGL